MQRSLCSFACIGVYRRLDVVGPEGLKSRRHQEGGPGVSHLADGGSDEQAVKARGESDEVALADAMAVEPGVDAVVVVEPNAEGLDISPGDGEEGVVVGDGVVDASDGVGDVDAAGLDVSGGEGLEASDDIAQGGGVAESGTGVFGAA